MKKIEAIIRPGKLDGVKDALGKFGVTGITVTQVIGFGNQKGNTQVYRGVEYAVHLIPKIKIELVVPDNIVEQLIEIICEQGRTGEIGDGKIFVSTVDTAVRIRTGQKGEEAL